MKCSFFTFLFFFTILSTAQDKTFFLSESDSLSNSKKANEHKIIEAIPVYKGCEEKTDNPAKKQCMSQNIAKLFNDNFNTFIPSNSKLKPGLTSILVTFKINTLGEIIDIKVKAEDEHLVKEATRVTELIPNLTPGHKRGIPVVVPYTLPLKINLETSKKEETRFPVFRGCNKDLPNEELKKCSIRKIKNFIKLSFDYEMADRVFPLEQSTKFQLDFIINKKGKVESVNAKANHRAIAIEAIKIAKRIPKFKVPGIKNGKPVDTPFGLLMTVYFQ